MQKLESTGERGFGRKEDEDSLQKAGLVKPYCTGGPGYIMSRSLLRETVRTIDTCIDNARTSIYKQYNMALGCDGWSLCLSRQAWGALKPVTITALGPFVKTTKVRKIL